MFCAGQYDYDQPETSTCGGDSGGPLYSLDDRRNAEIIAPHLPPGQVKEVQVGITSWGRKACEGGVENPSVFAKVSTMVEWFGPMVCNYFEYGRDRPTWCNVCSGGGVNEQRPPPRWCEEVKEPQDDDEGDGNNGGPSKEGRFGAAGGSINNVVNPPSGKIDAIQEDVPPPAPAPPAPAPAPTAAEPEEEEEDEEEDEE
uniref:Peptidase S1 domain-containing protein n=1 Tax=Odontella aurita TaxID=265563 RepID=A0A7S4JVE1_9STRA